MGGRHIRKQHRSRGADVGDVLETPLEFRSYIPNKYISRALALSLPPSLSFSLSASLSLSFALSLVLSCSFVL
jgi:hypothetical protein